MFVHIKVVALPAFDSEKVSRMLFYRFIVICSCAVILMFVVKFTEVKETHRCYRQDIADTLVSFCSSSMLLFFSVYSCEVHTCNR